MKRTTYYGYFALGLAVITLLSISPRKMHRLRASLVSKALQVENSLFKKHSELKFLKEKIAILKEENSYLKTRFSEDFGKFYEISKTNIATVIFRDPAFWSSSVLVNVGADSPNCEIEKNSPVLSGGYLIGIVEEVFDRVSKIRLISDKHLQVSIKKKDDQDYLDHELNVGTLFGISSINNRYRFKNVEGVFFSQSIKKDDELVTSGLDGVFPPNIPVAIVTEVTYDQEEVSHPFKAIILASDIKDLRYVTILKPLVAH